MTVAETAALLSAIGRKRITPAEVQADVDAGAPVDARGRINLVQYNAWLGRRSEDLHSMIPKHRHNVSWCSPACEQGGHRPHVGVDVLEEEFVAGA